MDHRCDSFSGFLLSFFFYETTKFRERIVIFLSGFCVRVFHMV